LGHCTGFLNIVNAAATSAKLLRDQAHWLHAGSEGGTLADRVPDATTADAAGALGEGEIVR
jgi:hypothetical protein